MCTSETRSPWQRWYASASLRLRSLTLILRTSSHPKRPRPLQLRDIVAV